MSRAGTVAAAAVLVGALALTAIAPLQPEPAVGEGTQEDAAAPAIAAAATRYSMPLEGEVVELFDAPDVRWAAGHRGVDIAGAVDVPIYAAADGVVTFAGFVVDRPVISIDHTDGIRTAYEPVESSVTAGQSVVRGQVIGMLIAAGSHCTPDACLHWGARIGQDYIDPLSLLAEAVIRLYPVSDVGLTRLPQYRAVARRRSNVSGFRRAGVPG